MISSMYDTKRDGVGKKSVKKQTRERISFTDFCADCGEAFEEGAKFCTGCGAERAIQETAQREHEHELASRASQETEQRKPEHELASRASQETEQRKPELELGDAYMMRTSDISKYAVGQEYDGRTIVRIAPYTPGARKGPGKLVLGENEAKKALLSHRFKPLPTQAAAVQAAAAAVDYAALVTEIYQKHNPEKLADPEFVGVTLAKYAGREEQLLTALRKKYAAAPAAAEKAEAAEKAAAAKNQHSNPKESRAVNVKRQNKKVTFKVVGGTRHHKSRTHKSKRYKSKRCKSKRHKSKRRKSRTHKSKRRKSRPRKY